MKITKKQRKKIIMEAITKVKNGHMFLCIILAGIIRDKHTGRYMPKPQDIQKYIPEFKNSIAVKHFNAERKFYWWGMREKDQRNRIRFLRYLLTGKLPKKASKKK
jgi:hypothetical protein